MAGGFQGDMLEPQGANAEGNNGWAEGGEWWKEGEHALPIPLQLVFCLRYP